MAALEVELTAKGYLQLPSELAGEYFPQDLLGPVLRGGELWLYPLRGAGGGGMILKQRNRAGDRSVLIWELLPEATPPGLHPAFWDDEAGALRIALISSLDSALDPEAPAPSRRPVAEPTRAVGSLP